MPPTRKRARLRRGAQEAARAIPAGERRGWRMLNCARGPPHVAADRAVSGQSQRHCRCGQAGRRELVVQDYASASHHRPHIGRTHSVFGELCDPAFAILAVMSALCAFVTATTNAAPLPTSAATQQFFVDFTGQRQHPPYVVLPVGVQCPECCPWQPALEIGKNSSSTDSFRTRRRHTR